MRSLWFRVAVAGLTAVLLTLIFSPMGWAQETPAAAPGNSAQGARDKIQSSSAAALVPAAPDPSEGSTESWSTPSLAGSALEPDEPLLGEKDDEHEFTREWVRVQWRANDPIDLFVILPKGVKKPPVILYLFSFPSEADRFENDDYCKLLTKDGVAAVGFLSAVTGERFHPPRRLKDWFVSEMPEALATSAHDVQMILNYLQKRGDLDMDRVGMFGDGSGASIAILAAAVDPRIKTLDLLDPWGDWPEWLANSTLVPENERADYVKAEFLERLAPLDPVKWFPELKSRQVRLQVVGDITVTPKTAMQAVAAAAPPNVKVVRYPDRKAYFLQEATSSKIFEWIKGQVQASGSAHHPNTENAERSRSVSKVEEAQR